jgi:hypothetical protein
MFTLTFAEHVTDLNEAKRRWKNLRESTERHLGGKFKAVWVWQLTKAMRWHLHGVAGHFLDVSWFRPLAEDRGFGRMMVLKRVGGRNGFRGDRHCENGKAVARYVTRYITRDMSEDCLSGAVVAGACGGARVWSVRFAWLRGLSQLYRLGCQMASDMGHQVRECSFQFLVRLGWESASERDQELMVELSRQVRRWWYGEPGPDNPLEPF